MDIRPGDLIYFNPEDGKKKSKLCAHSLDPFAVLGHTTGTLNIQREDPVERVNGDMMTQAPRMDGTGNNAMDNGDTATPEGKLQKDATQGDMVSNNYQGECWPVRGLVVHSINTDVTAELHVVCEG